MKILLGIITAILVITAAGSGYMVYNLNGQIDSLQNELAASMEDMALRLEGQIKAGDEHVTDALENNGEELEAFQSSAEEQFIQLKQQTEYNNSMIAGLDNRIVTAVDQIKDSTFDTAALFEESKEAIVRITDGENLIGSGFIFNGTPGTSLEITKKVVTAYHVVEDLDDIYVTLHDGRTWKAVVWASCEGSDIAILNFIAANSGDLPDMLHIPGITLADSQTVKPGDPVYVIGSPGSENNVMGLPDTVTSGIVSQVNRHATISGKNIANLVQIDAPVNFGNSGGPLFNRQGEVIGIVIARMDPELGDGISFAVAGNMIKKVENTIINGQIGPYEYSLPWMGVALADILPSDVVENNNNVTFGAKVMSVTGPAQSAGIKAGDIITGLDEIVTRDIGEVTSILWEHYTPGDSVVVKVRRGGSEFVFSLDLEARP